MDGIALASVISSGFVGAAAIAGSAWGIRWSASLNRKNWLHERRAEAYIEMVEAIERHGEYWNECARGRAFPDIVPSPRDTDSVEANSARLAALEQIYANTGLHQALHSWRYSITQIGEALSYPDANESEVLETRSFLYGEIGTDDGGGIVQLERELRLQVVEVIAKELGQRD